MSETKAIIIIKILTPNKYLIISGVGEDFFPIPDPSRITK